MSSVLARSSGGCYSALHVTLPTERLLLTVSTYSICKQVNPNLITAGTLLILSLPYSIFLQCRLVCSVLFFECASTERPTCS